MKSDSPEQQSLSSTPAASMSSSNPVIDPQDAALEELRQVEKAFFLHCHRKRCLEDQSAILWEKKAEIEAAEREFNAAIKPFLEARETRIKAAKDKCSAAYAELQFKVKALVQDEEQKLGSLQQTVFARIKSLPGYDNAAFNALLRKLYDEHSADLSLIYEPADITAHTSKKFPFRLRVEVPGKSLDDAVRIARNIPGFRPDDRANYHKSRDVTLVDGWLSEPLSLQTLPSQIRALYDGSARLFWMNSTPRD